MNNENESMKINYVAFLRGVNVGGNRFKMEDLRNAFKEWGFEGVSTYLASGNIRFSTDKSDENALRIEIHDGIEEKFGLDISVIVRTFEYLKNLAAKEPFYEFKENENTRFYMSFSAKPIKSEIKVPYISEEGNLEIPFVTDREVFSVVRLGENYGTLDAMDFIEKEFGKDITTRNWNTIEKILAE